MRREPALLLPNLQCNKYPLPGQPKGRGMGVNCPRASRSRGPHKVMNSVFRMGFINCSKILPKISTAFETIGRNYYKKNSEIHFKLIWRVWSQTFFYSHCLQGALSFAFDPWPPKPLCGPASCPPQFSIIDQLG